MTLLGHGNGFSFEASPYCSYAARDGVHVLLAGEVAEWPGISAVAAAHDGELQCDIYAQQQCMYCADCSLFGAVWLHLPSNRMSMPLPFIIQCSDAMLHLNVTGAAMAQQCSKQASSQLNLYVYCVTCDTAFIRNEPPLEQNDAHWLLDFYTSFMSCNSQDTTDRALECLSKVGNQVMKSHVALNVRYTERSVA